MNVEEMISKMTLEEKAGMCSGLDFWHFKGVERLGIPSLMVSDGPHGLRKQDDAQNADMLGINESVTAICFPTASALAASFDRQLLTEVGKTLGEECQALNISVLLGPGNNIKRSPLCGRNFEYFSEDPYLASEMAAAHISGVQSQGIGTSMKHFCANNQETRRMTCSADIDERTLREIYLAAFEGAVKKAKPTTIMCSYNQVNGTFLAENKKLLTDILRKEWGYQGIVITDWGAVKDRVKGIEAGLNIEMPGGNGATDAQIIEAVKKGTLSIEKLDEIVKEILNFIAWSMEHKQEKASFDYERDHAKAADIAKECAVLLKNEEKILPLSKSESVAIIGEFAEKPRYQGSGSSHINSWKVDSVLDALKDQSDIRYAKGYSARESVTDQVLLKEAVTIAKETDVAVIFAGLPDAFESEGFDRKHLRLPDNQIELIQAVSEVQKNTVVVLHNGAPIEMPWIDCVKAVLEMYLSGEGVGEADAALLFGDANPSGKLAETFPLKLSDNPSYLSFPGNGDAVSYQEGIYVGYRYYDKKELDVLFPFGHGLSYTTFEYSDMSVSKDAVTDQERFSVTCKIKNTGNIKGKEVVQLYVGPADLSERRTQIPVRALKGFEKLELEPEETKEVTFELDKSAFAYYDVVLGDWYAESGNYVISIGASSRDIRLSAPIAVESTIEVPIKITGYTAVADILSIAKGREILGRIISGGQDRFAADGQLGEGGKKMMQAMEREMPLAMLAAMGMMTQEQLEQILRELNA